MRIEKTYLNKSLSIVKMLIIKRIFDSQKWGVLSFLHAFLPIKWKISSLSPKLYLTLHSFLENNLKRMVYEISSYYR